MAEEKGQNWREIRPVNISGVGGHERAGGEKDIFRGAFVIGELNH